MKLRRWLSGLTLLFLTNVSILQATNDRNADLYVDLLKRCVMNSIYEDPAMDGQYDASKREQGTDFPSVAHTMIGKKRLDNLQYCMEEVLKNHVEGDFIETGVWRGGATIFMRGFLKAHNDTTRKVWVADSFNGLPPPNPNYPLDDYDFSTVTYLKISKEEVMRNFNRYGLLDEQVVFLKGYFCHSLPTAPINKISIMRLDGDMYQSTMDALVNLYPKLSVGGFVIIDDYSIPACAKAVHDFRQWLAIDDPIKMIDATSVYWHRTK